MKILLFFCITWMPKDIPTIGTERCTTPALTKNKKMKTKCFFSNILVNICRGN